MINAVLRPARLHSGTGRHLLKHLVVDVNGIWETSVGSDYEMPWDVFDPWDDTDINFDPWEPGYGYSGVYDPEAGFNDFMSLFSTIGAYETTEVVAYFDDGSDLTGVSKWWGGCLSESGMIYGIPYNDTRILKINPRTNKVSFFGEFEGTAKWKGGVVGRNGKIYCVPHNSTSVLVIDPSDDSTSLIEGLSESIEKWGGGVLGPDGYIYCCPDPSSSGTTIGSMLVIDPSSDIAFTRSSIMRGVGMALSRNGYALTAYCGENYPSYSRIDLSSGIETQSGFYTSSYYDGQCGAVLAPNGKVYCPIGRVGVLPTSGSSLINTKTVCLTDSPLSLSRLSKTYSPYRAHIFSGGVLAPNGHIYCVPLTFGFIDRIDPTDNAIASIAAVSSDANKWAGGVLAPNGRIYFIPHNYNKVLELSNVGEMNSKTVLLTHPYVNKF